MAEIKTLNNVLQAAVLYTLVSLGLAFVWYVLLFQQLYQRFAYFNGEPNLLLGFISIVIQGMLLSILYPLVNVKANNVFAGLKYALLVGLFFWTSHVLAFVAKQTVDDAVLFVLMETVYLILQFGIYGVGLGLIFKQKEDLKEEQALERPRQRFNSTSVNTVSDAKELDKHNWRYGEVDDDSECFQISFGDPENSDTADRPIIARVGKPRSGLFSVKLLSDKEEHIAALGREIQFYLNQLPNERLITDVIEIWEYQLYHCTTTANFYGKCHWHYCALASSFAKQGQ